MVIIEHAHSYRLVCGITHAQSTFEIFCSKIYFIIITLKKTINSSLEEKQNLNSLNIYINNKYVMIYLLCQKNKKKVKGVVSSNRLTSYILAYDKW